MEYKDIVAYVSDKHNISQHKLNSRTRMGPETKARQEIMYMAFVNDMSIKEIAAKINRSYHTVKHGIETHGKLVRKAGGNVEPMPRSSTEDKIRLRQHLLTMKLKMGSISGIMQDLVSDEVADFIVTKTLQGGYESVAELFADCITEIYFQEQAKR